MFNFGNNLPIRTKDLVSKIEEILNKKAKINNIPSSNEIFVTNANIDKSKKLLNYNPKISFDEGIKSLLTGIISRIEIFSPGGEIGRHKGLKIPRRKLRAGSSPALGTS